jgi:hypothetical protein
MVINTAGAEKRMQSLRDDKCLRQAKAGVFSFSGREVSHDVRNVMKTDDKTGSAIWRKPGGSGRISDFIFLFLE